MHALPYMHIESRCASIHILLREQLKKQQFAWNFAFTVAFFLTHTAVRLTNFDECCLVLNACSHSPMQNSPRARTRETQIVVTRRWKEYNRHLTRCSLPTNSSHRATLPTFLLCRCGHGIMYNIQTTDQSRMIKWRRHAMQGR